MYQITRNLLKIVASLFIFQSEAKCMSYFLSYQFSEVGYEVQEQNFQLNNGDPFGEKKNRVASYVTMLCPPTSHSLLQNYF